MPFQSEKQRRYLWANEPEIARDWSKKYGSRVRKYKGGDITNFDPMPTNVRAVYPAAADYNMNLGLQNYDTSGGYLSNARHAAASSLMRDQLGGGIGGKIGANALGALNELSGLGKGVYGEAKELFGGPKHSFMNTLGQTGEDLVANLYGSLYGKPVTDEMEYNISPAENVYKDMMRQLGSSKSDGLKGILEQMMEGQAQANLKHDPNSLTKAKLAEALNTRMAKGSWPGPYNQRGDYLVGTEADAANKMASLSMSNAINSPDIQIAQKLANLDKIIQESRPRFPQESRPGFPHDSSVYDKWGNIQMAKEKMDSPRPQKKGFWDTVRGGITNVLDNTVIGKIAALNSPFNPRAANYQPGFRESVDQYRKQGLVNPAGKIMSGPMQGYNMVSGSGSNNYRNMISKRMQNQGMFGLRGPNNEIRNQQKYNQLKAELQKETQRQRNQPTTGGLHGGMSYNQYVDTMVQDRSPGRRNRPGGIGGKELMAQGGIAGLWPR